jgi:hypothetical protein
MTTQAGAATAPRTVRQIGFSFTASLIPGNPRDLLLDSVVLTHIARGETANISCRHCSRGHFTKPVLHRQRGTWGTHPAFLMTPRTEFFAAATAPGKIGVLKGYVVKPRPLLLALEGYACLAPGVGATQAILHPSSVPTVSCPPSLTLPPLDLLYPGVEHHYRSGSPITFYVEVTGPLPSDEYFWVGVQTKHQHAPKCTNFESSRYVYTKTFGSIIKLTLYPPGGLDAKGRLGQKHWCTGGAEAFVFTERSSPGVNGTNVYGSRPIMIVR